MRRGFPGTHHFARARLVFAVAGNRCKELFKRPGCATLWNLPADLEDRFDARWRQWMEDASHWVSFIDELDQVIKSPLLSCLSRLGLMSTAQEETIQGLRASVDGPAFPLPGIYVPGNEVLILLAAGFALGSEENLSIPYARLEDD